MAQQPSKLFSITDLLSNLPSFQFARSSLHLSRKPRTLRSSTILLSHPVKSCLILVEIYKKRFTDFLGFGSNQNNIDLGIKYSKLELALLTDLTPHIVQSSFLLPSISITNVTVYLLSKYVHFTFFRCMSCNRLIFEVLAVSQPKARFTYFGHTPI